jgi:hypothetical protein
MSDRRGKWIYSISGMTTPIDAPAAFTSKGEAVAAALADYWTSEDREALRKYPENKLRFHVGLVTASRRKPISGETLRVQLADAQSELADVPINWPPDREQSIRNLEALVDAAVHAWLVAEKALADWDEVTYEAVEVDP